MSVFKTVEVSSFKFGTVIAAVESHLCKSVSVSLDWENEEKKKRKKVAYIFGFESKVDDH